MKRPSTLPAPRDTARIRADLARARDEVAESLLALREEVKLRTDWKEWVRRKPVLVLGCAFALGFWLGKR